MNPATIDFSEQLYELIRRRTDDKTAHEAVRIVEGMVNENVAKREDRLATREDLLLVKEELKDKIADQFKRMISLIVTLAVLILGLYGTIIFGVLLKH